MAMLLITPGPAAPARPVWRDMTSRARELARTLRPPAPLAAERFDPAVLAALPEPARRWLAHAIAPGTPLAMAAELQLHGEVRLGHWRPFTATQALVPDDGYVWAGRTRVAGLPVRGFDSYSAGRGLLRWRGLGVVPVLAGSGFDVTLSAAHRLAAESVLVPPSVLRSRWHEGDEPDTAVFEHGYADHGGTTRITITVAPDGALRKVSLHRWGNPTGGAYGLFGFEVDFGGEYRCGGLRIGDGMRAAWIDHSGHRMEFYRAWIDSADFMINRPIPSTID